ncbi:MAG: rubredoxin [Candidatus Paceibacterota bacterium]|jgi:rubredoxin-NAD+ reductase
MSQYICLECGWIYDETKGLPEKGIVPGTKWEELPDDFKCEDCSIRKSDTDMWQKID